MADKTHPKPASISLPSNLGIVSKRASGQKLTRNRTPLSCMSCRLRKLKCNRERPCQNCVTRGRDNAATCCYAEKGKAERRGRGGKVVTPRVEGEDMKQRLSHLESSILSMLNQNQTEKRERTASDSGVATLRMCACVSGSQKMSFDARSTHWHAVLKEIEEMKDACSDDNDTIEYPEVPLPKFRPNLLNGLVQPLDRRTLLGSLPVKNECDVLVDRFFEAPNPLLPVRVLLHKATFLKQYQQHWLTPDESRIIWISLLYSILCFATYSSSRNDEIPAEDIADSVKTTDLYRLRTAQCIATANILKPTEFTIEALMMYSYMEFRNVGDGHIGPFILSGTIIRIALQQGYHEDPSGIPSLTVFQREMRRRVWCSITQYELITSGMMGLPKCWKYGDCDTFLPRNLHEEELWEDMKVLPPSRPLSEHTHITYFVIKAELLRGFGFVLEFLHTLTPQPYEEVTRLDRNLMQTRERIPKYLRFSTLDEMMDDLPSSIIEKYILEHFYHKAVCVLHRKFWDGAPYSRKTCITSALTLLQHQATLHRAHRPGGILCKIPWYQTVVFIHDFLLAAMILALDIVSIRFAENSNVPHYVASEEEKIAALKESRAIWANVSNECRDAPRAVKILDTVLGIVYKQRKKLELVAREEISPVHSLCHPVTSMNTSAIPALQNGYGNETAGFETGVRGLGGRNIDMGDSIWGAMGSPNLELPADFNWDIWDQLMATQQIQSQPNWETGISLNGVSK